MTCHVEAVYLTMRFWLSVPGVFRLLKKKCFQPSGASAPELCWPWPLARSAVVSPGASPSWWCDIRLVLNARRKLTFAIIR